MAFACDVLIEEGCGRQELDPRRGQLRGHSAEQRLGITHFQARENDESTEVRPQVEKISRGDLAGHQRLVGTGFFRGVQKLSELPDVHAMDFVRELFHLRKGFPLEGDQRDPAHAGGAGAFDHQARIVAAAGDEK